MTSYPVYYDDGCDKYVWCVDDLGVIRVWPLAGFGDGDPRATLTEWGWRFATDNEVLEYLPLLQSR